MSCSHALLLELVDELPFDVSLLLLRGRTVRAPSETCELGLTLPALPTSIAAGVPARRHATAAAEKIRRPATIFMNAQTAREMRRRFDWG